MKFVFWSAVVFFLLSFIPGQAQEGFCGSDIFYQKLLNTNPELAKIAAERMAYDDEHAWRQQPTRALRVIPVVFHIIHQYGAEDIPDEYVYGMIQQLNEDMKAINTDLSNARTQFRSLATDFQVEFRLARIDPNGKCTNGIERIVSDLTVEADDAVKSLSWWDNKKYLNIWVVKTINSSGSTGIILGYSYLPWMANSQPSKDGIVIRADVIGYGYRTLTHEVGHYLGLMHTFESGCPSSGADCNKTGDRVCDTPPESTEHFNCDYTQNSCTTETPDQFDMIENHMSYTSCRVMFTAGQKARVDYNLQQYRSQMYTEANLRVTGVFDTTSYACIPTADFTSDLNASCVGNSVQFSNLSLGGSSPDFNWFFDGGNPSTSISKNPLVTYNAPGKFKVKLVVSNSKGTDSIVKTDYISIYPAKGEETPLKQDYESADVIDSFGYYIQPAGIVQWQRTSKGYHSGYNSLYLNNFQNMDIGQIYSFILPPVNLRGVVNPQISFWYSFAKKASDNKDNLRVYTSTDCGKSWNILIYKNPIGLPTTTTYYGSFEFKPNIPSLWREETASLYDYRNSDNLYMKFQFTTGGGNNIYFDDINIGSPVSGISEKISGQVAVYPNPVCHEMVIELFSRSRVTSVLTILDLMGKRVLEIPVSLVSGNNIFRLDTDQYDLKSGVYMLFIENGIQVFRKEFIISK